MIWREISGINLVALCDLLDFFCSGIQCCISWLYSLFLVLYDRISVGEKANRRPHISSKSFMEIRKSKHHICWFSSISTIMPGSAYFVRLDKNLLAVFLTK